MQTQTLQLAYPRPFIKWAGGKGRLIQQYTPFFPQNFKTYYEPFLGGGAIFFHLHPKRAILMDINPELVNVYRCVRDEVELLIQLLWQHQQKHCPDYYYWVRANSKGNNIEKAARLIYLNKTCFNGLYRENSKGQFNVPIGRYKNPRICDPDLLRSTSFTLRNARIEVNHFDATLKYAKPEDFVYFDPPYYPLSSTSNFTAYNRYAFNKDDQIRLKNIFAILVKRGVKVMLSNSDCSFIRELYSGFNIHTILAARAINSNATKRGKITELLITGY
jgi:DNA adenine methylase